MNINNRLKEGSIGVNNMTIEKSIFLETGKTFEEIRIMSNVELYDFIEEIREKAWSDGYDAANMPSF